MNPETAEAAGGGEDEAPAEPWRGGANPHNLEAEQAVLGGLLLEPEQYDLIEGRLFREDFFVAAHGTVFAAMQALKKKGRGIDPVLLRNELRDGGGLEAVGGAEGLVSLTDAAISGANVEHYAEIVRELSLRRRLIQTLNQSLAAAAAPGSGVTELLNDAENGIRAISAGDLQGHTFTFKEALNRTWDNIEAFKSDKVLPDVVYTGFTELDHKLTGFHNDELIIAAGRPSMGKSTFALNVARNVAVKSGLPVAVFTLEMTAENIARNILIAHARADGQKVRDFSLGNQEIRGLADATAEILEAGIWIDETPAISIAELRGKTRRLKLRHDVRLIVVDYLQLMSASSQSRNRSREQEVSEVSRSLKALAKELHVPVLAISQLSRQPEGRNDKRPILSDLRESGGIEQDADVVLMLHRPEYYNPEDRPGEAEVIVAKQRNGPTGSVFLAFIGGQLRFENLAHRGDYDPAGRR
jgi:replicative DNA helicase